MDSDRSGMAIRNYLISAIGPEYIRNAYIPDCYGTEKRKKHPSAEGKLGVEGLREDVLSSILSVAKVPRDDAVDPITNADLYNAGLLGGRNSATVFPSRVTLKPEFSSAERSRFLSFTVTYAVFDEL